MQRLGVHLGPLALMRRFRRQVLDEVAGRGRGRGHELIDAEFVNRSVCSECGARWPNISISLEPVSTRGAKMGYT